MDLKQIRVVIASPNDVKRERKALENIIEKVNDLTAQRLGLILKLVRWEKDAFPGLNKERPQGQINPSLDIDNCDIFICIFWNRFGTPIKENDKTGTEYEFYKAYESWRQKNKPHIMIYFNQRKSSFENPEEAEQRKCVLEFKKKLPKECLSWNYNGLEQFKEYALSHITKYLNDKFSNGLNNQVIESNQEIENFLNRYKNSLEKKVCKIRILGDTKEYDLTDVFVDLQINHEFKRPSSQTTREFESMIDSQSRKRIQIFSNIHSDVDSLNIAKKYNIINIKPEHLLKTKTRTIIVGAPGSGKIYFIALSNFKNLATRRIISNLYRTKEFVWIKF